VAVVIVKAYVFLGNVFTSDNKKGLTADEMAREDVNGKIKRNDKTDS